MYHAYFLCQHMQVFKDLVEGFKSEIQMIWDSDIVDQRALIFYEQME